MICWEQVVSKNTPKNQAGHFETSHMKSAAKKSPHMGTSFESWLDEVGIREEVTREAIKYVSKAKRKKQNRRQAFHWTCRLCLPPARVSRMPECSSCCRLEACEILRRINRRRALAQFEM